MSAGAFQEAFQINRIEFVNRIDLTDASELLLSLLSKGVLTRFQFDEIKTSPTNLGRAQKMMDILERRSDALYPLFIQALVECGQDRAVLLLNPASPGQASSMNSLSATRLPNPAAAAASHGATAASYVRTGVAFQIAPGPLRSDVVNAFPPDVKVEPYTFLSNLEKVAEGGFGIIHRATHKLYGEVAYKELKVSVMRTGDKASRELLREAQAQVLRHDNIVCVLAVIYEAGHYGVVLEYAAHGALDEFRDSYEIGYPAKLHLAMDVVLGMDYIHTRIEPVIHGDLKVQNVLVSRDCIAKICDFGLSKWKQFSTTKTGTRTQRGTLSNIPPENWQNVNAKRTVKYDVYGFGILLWELMSGNGAFADVADNPLLLKTQVMDNARPNLDDIEDDSLVVGPVKELIKACWNQKPEERPTFADVKQKFRTLLDGHMNEVDQAMDALRLRVQRSA